jgi:tellurite resistance protein TerB
MVFENILNRIKDAGNCVAGSLDRYKNKDFLEAFTAAIALVAFADGSIDATEKEKMKLQFEHNEALKSFDLIALVRSFKAFVELLELDTDIGENKCLSAIAKIKCKEEAGRSLLRICISIANADGQFDSDEQRVVEKIAREIGINLEEL